MNDFKSDLAAPLPAKTEDQHPSPQTVRVDGGGPSAGYVNLYGQIVKERPNIMRPTYPAGPAEAPRKPDASTKTATKVYVGDDFGTYRVTGSKVQDLRSGEYLEGKMEPAYGGFGVLVAKMTSHKLG